MRDTTFVFIHGGQHTGACWDPTRDAMQTLNPQARTLAVNLPGRANEPGDLATLTIEQCVASAVRQIKAVNPERVILVGHSMAGITLPGVAIKLGKPLVDRMVFISCCIPPEGKTVLDTLKWPIRPAVKMLSKGKTVTGKLSPWAASFFFGTGMTPDQKMKMLSCMCDESTALAHQPVSRVGLPDVSKTWIALKQDRALSIKTQHQFIANLGGVDEIIEMDTCHNVMISNPLDLAKTLSRY